MILEVVGIQIDPAKRAEFEQAVAQGVAATIVPAKGFRGYKLNAGIEQPGQSGQPKPESLKRVNAPNKIRSKVRKTMVQLSF